MSIYFEYNVDKNGHRFRRAVECDKYEIDIFLKQSPSGPLFGDVNIGAIIELSVLSICMIDEEQKVVGFLALSDHPNVSGLDASDWEHWLRNLYQRFYLSRNTLFIHFMCCTDAVTEFFLEEALISVFFNDCYLLHIVLVVPALCPQEFISRHAAFKKRNFQTFTPKRKEDKIGTYLMTAMRQDFCTKLRMRRAVEEDNDDVVEILDRICPRLKELYGMYYISEIIGRHPESRKKILVGDIQGRAVSIIGLNTDIDYKKLQNTYELKPFYGLNAPTPLEKEQHKRANKLLTLFGDPIVKGMRHPFDVTPKDSEKAYTPAEKNTKTKRSDNSKSSTDSNKVYFGKNITLKDHFEYNIVNRHSESIYDRMYTRSSTGLSQTTLVSIGEMLEDEPFDYDIVNIDRDWLRNVDASELRAGFGSSSLRILSQTNVSTQRKLRKPKVPRKTFKILDVKSSSVLQGEKNAFMIELFALREDIDERHSFDMLEAAFELMKEYDYCIIRIPSSDASFPLLQHFCFVPTRRRVSCEYALFVAHRNSVFGKLRVRPAEVTDIPEVANLLYPLDGKKLLYELEDIIFNKNLNQAYILTSGVIVVGLGILEPPEEVEFIQGRLNLDSYRIHKYHYQGHGVKAGFATLKSVIMYPVFEAHYRFFARELMRLSGSDTLMYMTGYRNKLTIHKGNTITTAMVPLLPRPFELDSDSVQNVKSLGVTSDAIVPFSAWFISKKITSIPKINITSRIVIIGASRTAQGFMQTLLFGPTSTYLTFTNVTLISPNGIRYARHSRPIEESMFLKFHTTSEMYLKSLPYNNYVNVIQGNMAEINLQEKFITLTSGNIYDYDLLFLFFGKQYQHPNYMSHLLKREKEYQSKLVPEYKRLDVPRYSDTEINITCDVTPDNVFIVNDTLDANRALNYIRLHKWQDNFKVIVYGARIHVYLCINALLTINVPAENIIFIEPFPPENPTKTRVTEFCNPYVDKTVNEVLTNLKIKVYRSYYFHKWTVNNENIVTDAAFLSQNDCLKIECSALFYYGKRGIDMNAYVAIHKSSLSFDGGVIVDQYCRTRDPSVYAAGPNIRYHRRYYADSYIHKYYDSYEVGSKLGAQIRNQLDPLFSEAKRDTDSQETGEHSSSDPDFKQPKLMRLTKPKVMYCVLPGGFRYLDVRSPGRKLPHHYLQSLENNGYVMETFKTGYFKIHLSKYLFVDGITCLTPAKYSLEKFKCLYGHSTVVLKNVHLRFSTNKLDDFYEFFRAPWASFLYHDQTEDLFTMSKELLPKNQDTGLTIKEALSNSLKEYAKASIQDDFKKSSYVEAITDYVIDWLSRNDILLPMYLQPWKSSLFTCDNALAMCNEHQD